MRIPVALALFPLLAACPPAGPSAPENHVPVSVAGSQQATFAGTTVTLDGSGSSDPDGDSLTYLWSQTGGTSVTLANAGSVTASFVAPTVTAPETLVFHLDVSDGQSTATSSTAVTVNPPDPGNHAPTASAVAPPNAQSGAQVTLDASASSDPDGDTLGFAWAQTAGPSVTLAAGTTSTATFTAPAVTADTALSFRVDVTDGRGGTAQAVATVTVKPASSNHPPVANAGTDQTVNAGASVTLNGSATDPDGDAIASYQWTQTAGSNVVLSSATAAKPTFTAPSPAATLALTFSLVATDSKGLASAPATVHVTVNAAPATAAVFTKVVSLHAVTRTGIVVFFQTDVSLKASVDYGKASTSEATFTEVSATTRHLVSLTGLTANTHYVYTVRAGTAVSSGSFWTAVDYQASPQPFSFAVVGDARVHSQWATVSAAILAKSPRFAIQSGDNNNNALVSAADWQDYYLKGKDMFASVPIFAAAGNHDVDLLGGSSTFSAYNLPAQSSSGSDLYYAFVYGNAGFVAINTNAASTGLSWVKSALTTLSGGPLFAFHHHPLYSCGSHGSDTSLQGTFQAAFEGAHLTVDFTGHDHDLIVWETVNGVRYVVSGGGGTSLYSLNNCKGPFAQSGYGFVMVDVDGQKVTETVYDQNGAQLYTTGQFNAQGASVNFTGLGSLVTY